MKTIFGSVLGYLLSWVLIYSVPATTSDKAFIYLMLSTILGIIIGRCIGNYFENKASSK